jgi:ABC-type molybdate transport system substrate-binding protein
VVSPLSGRTLWRGTTAAGRLELEIIYPTAVTANRKKPGAARLLDFLASPAAWPIFEKRGFAVLQ